MNFSTQGPIVSAVADVYIEPYTLSIISNIVHTFISADSSEPYKNKNGILFYLQSRTE